jgi:hypothetical protein
VALAGCSGTPTSVLLRIGAAPSAVSSLSAVVALDGGPPGAAVPVAGGGPVSLPGTAILRLSDGNRMVAVQLVAQLADGGVATAAGSVAIQPHQQVPLDLAFGAETNLDGGVPDLVTFDLAGADLLEHLIASDTFMRANQVFWGTASDGQSWGADANTMAPPFAISGKTGLLTSGAAGVSYSGTLGPTAVDADVLVSGDLDVVNQSCNFGPVARFVDGGDFYKAYLDGVDFVLQRNVGGVKLVLGAVGKPIVPGSVWNIRLQVQGTTLNARAWLSTSAEPSGWDLTATDAALSSGQVGIRALVNACQVQIRSFTAMGN